MSIDISWLLFVIVVILTGQLTNYLVLLVIMCWHECGHFLTALYFKWPIKELRLFMFGCVMETDAFLMRPLKEQWLVVLAGPLQHVAIFFACLFLKQSAQPMTVIDFAMRANVTLVCFNLLPIWPLDGGKIIYLLCNLRLPFKKSYHLTLMLSILNIFILTWGFIFYGHFSFAFLLLVGFLLREIRLDLKDEPYMWYRFLLFRRKNMIKQPLLAHIDSDVQPNQALKCLRLNQSTMFIIKQTHQLISEQQMIERYMNPVKYYLEIGD
ncbi:hypothetical protein HMI01_07870 [Halolactibacillus miurensis]|nr:hypothetical protein HMI01_07870 [Halolactibacillus miurensis]